MTADQPDALPLYRRSLIVVAISQAFGGAGLAAGVTVGGLLAQDMIGGASAAGLPVALFTLGSASASYAIGRYTQRAGRRLGLAAGFFAGSAGAAGIVVAAVAGSTAMLFLAMLVYGAGTASNLQARYAGTDLAPAASRGTAVSVALVATTAGAVAGPLSVNLLGDLARHLGLPTLTGPFLLAAVAYGLAGLILFVFLRPDPYLTAMVIAEPATSADQRASYSPGVVVGATVMVLTQIAMVAIMTMTPVHMREHDHGLGQVGLVISLHIAAMFLPSLVTGRLVDRFGTLPMAVVSAVVLLLAGVTAAAAPADSMVWLTVALILLGLGWNVGLISGTALIVDSTPAASRAKTQGAVDVLISLSGAGGGVASGLIVGASSYAALSLGGGLLALLLVPVVLRYRARTG